MTHIVQALRMDHKVTTNRLTTRTAEPAEARRPLSDAHGAS